MLTVVLNTIVLASSLQEVIVETIILSTIKMQMALVAADKSDQMFRFHSTIT